MHIIDQDMNALIDTTSNIKMLSTKVQSQVLLSQESIMKLSYSGQWMFLKGLQSGLLNPIQLILRFVILMVRIIVLVQIRSNGNVVCVR